MARSLYDAGMSFKLLATGQNAALRRMRNCLGSYQVSAGDIVTDSPDLIVRLRDAVTGTDTVIVPVGLQPTLFVARNRSNLPPHNTFPVSSPETIEELDDKWRFYQLLERLSLPAPATILVESLDDLPKLPAGRLVLKPVHGEGSLGLRFADTPAEAAAIITGIDAVGLLPVLAQEYIPGFDMTLSVVAHNGELLGGRVQRVLADGSVEFLDLPAAIDIAAAVVKSRSASGVLSFDLRGVPNGDSVFLTECNPRLWASCHKSAYTGMNAVAIGSPWPAGNPWRSRPSHPPRSSPPPRRWPAPSAAHPL